MSAHRKGEPYYRVLDDYLAVVRNRQSPQALGETFAMKPISIEVHGAVALAKVRCQIFGFDYLDFLSMLEQDGRWGIVAKVFTDNSATHSELRCLTRGAIPEGSREPLTVKTEALEDRRVTSISHEGR
jgi:hypothetical protein